LLDGFPEELVTRIAQHVAEFLIEVDEDAVQIDAGNADRGLLEGFLETPLELAALGDVYDSTDQPGDSSLGVGEGRLVIDGLAYLAVASGNGDLIALGSRALPKLLIHLVVALRHLRALGVKIVDALTKKGGARHAEELLPRLVHTEILA